MIVSGRIRPSGSARSRARSSAASASRLSPISLMGGVEEQGVMAAQVGIRDSSERSATGASSSIARSGLPSAR
jgi:hypothetical protein